MVRGSNPKPFQELVLSLGAFVGVGELSEQQQQHDNNGGCGASFWGWRGYNRGGHFSCIRAFIRNLFY